MSAAMAAPGLRVSTPVRAIAGLGLMFLAVILVVEDSVVRAGEATVLAWLMEPLADGASRAVGDIVVVGGGTGASLAVQITFMCSTVVLLVPLLLLAGLAMFPTRFPARRVGAGLLQAGSIVVAANLVRYGGVLLAYQAWGERGFELSHHLVGSIFVVAAFVMALARFIVVLGRGR